MSWKVFFFAYVFSSIANNMCVQSTQSHSPETRQVGVFKMTHLSSCHLGVISCSAAVTGLLRLFVPSQPQRGAVNLGTLRPGLFWLTLHPPSLTGQALVDLRGHGQESPLYVIRALGACLQEGDLKRGGQVLQRDGGEGSRDRGRNPSSQICNMQTQLYLEVKH